MSKKRISLRDNSPLSGLISEPEDGPDAVTQSNSHSVTKAKRHSDEIQQETLYLHPEQVIELEDLVLKLKRRRPRIKTSKSALARAAIDLLLEKEPEEIAAML